MQPEEEASNAEVQLASNKVAGGYACLREFRKKLSFFKSHYLMKKTIQIVADKTIIDRYKIQSFDYFNTREKIEEHSFANYAREFISILEIEFSSKYDKLIFADLDDIRFFRSNKRDFNIPEKYKIIKSAQLTLLLEEEYVDRFYNLMNTYYKNELLTVMSVYSFSLFIVDVLDLMEKYIY